MRTLTRGLTGLALTVALASPALAQQPSQPLSGGNDRTMLVGLGLTFLNAADETAIGVAGNALFNVLKATEHGNIGIAADVGVNSFDGGTVTTFMGGPRFTFNTSGKLQPYGQFLIGIAHCCGDSDFEPALGFGVDIAWTPKVNFRGELQFFFGDVDATRWFFGI